MTVHAGPKRHHYVPRMYLERFALRSQVFVRRRDGKSFTSNCINVAVESGFYDVGVSNDSEAPSKVVEEALADVEGAVGAAFEEIDSTGIPPPVHSENRAVLATYLALQVTRTPEQRERVLFPARLAEYLGERQLTREAVTEYLREVHLGFAPSQPEIGAAFDLAKVALRDREVLTPEFAMSEMLGSVAELAPILQGRSWAVENDRKRRFITSDAPLVIWRPPTTRDEYEGVGVVNAEELRFPLDPEKQLVLTRKPRTPSRRVTPGRTAACNTDSAAGCHRFIVGHVAEAGRINALTLAPHRPVLRFDTGPLYERSPDGQEVYTGEVIHTWVPRR